MLKCGGSVKGFATYPCLDCGQGKYKVNFSCKGKTCPQCKKRYAWESMVTIGVCLFPRVSYRQVVLTLPEKLRIPFHNHSNQKHLYSGSMVLSEACLSKLMQAHFKSNVCKIAGIVFIHTNICNGNYNPHSNVILAEGALFSSN
ncbi:transposase zinc-binding domain-containing protein [Candidatus Enterovibrio escicola]|uniref:transposase zinc-binding domain-containing protein n=1 Tax=Candidatus Enterovibrio escicola TaxID=1927127 RepID=UPI001237F322|nr:transposase zinc-binding domain-containing protein [Candidatus Enterovibrio escacola]